MRKTEMTEEAILDKIVALTEVEERIEKNQERVEYQYSNGDIDVDDYCMLIDADRDELVAAKVELFFLQEELDERYVIEAAGNFESPVLR